MWPDLVIIGGGISKESAKWLSYVDVRCPLAVGKFLNNSGIVGAALTAAHYLCASGGNLSTAAGWWRAVLRYNSSVTYGRDVFSGADAYAKAAAKL